MQQCKYQQAKSWADIISTATKLCFEHRLEWSDSSFFESTSQALKAKLGHTEQSKLQNNEGVLQDLVTPFFAPTKYAVDKRIEIKDENDDKRYKPREAWVPNGRRTAAPIYKALQELIAEYPDDADLGHLKHDIEAQAALLPESMQQELGLSFEEDRSDNMVCAHVAVATPEYVS